MSKKKIYREKMDQFLRQLPLSTACCLKITLFRYGRSLRASSHQYQKGPGLSGSSYMLNPLSINGFFSDLEGEGEILIVVFSTEIPFFCQQGFRGYRQCRNRDFENVDCPGSNKHYFP